MKFIEHYYVGEDYEETFFMEENGDVFFRCYIYHDRPSTLVFDMFSVSERARKIGLGTEVGKIENILNPKTNPLFIINEDAENELLIPANEELIISVDDDKKVIVADLPEGLY